MTYAEAVKTLRKKMLLTQTEMAEKLGVAFISINRWEKGHCEPTMKAKRKLALLFNKYGIKIEE
jgi:DNA-binding XRE family transcriptional regulator